MKQNEKFSMQLSFPAVQRALTKRHCAQVGEHCWKIWQASKAVLNQITPANDE
jgi:hypothetical protein